MSRVELISECLLWNFPPDIHQSEPMLYIVQTFIFTQHKLLKIVFEQVLTGMYGLENLIDYLTRFPSEHFSYIFFKFKSPNTTK